MGTDFHLFEEFRENLLHLWDSDSTTNQLNYVDFALLLVGFFQNLLNRLEELLELRGNDFLEGASLDCGGEVFIVH